MKAIQALKYNNDEEEKCVSNKEKKMKLINIAKLKVGAAFSLQKLFLPKTKIGMKWLK